MYSNHYSLGMIQKSELTNDELNAFLAELEQENPGSTGLTKEQIAKLQREEAEELESAIPNEDITSDKAWGWARKDNEQKVVCVKQFEPALRSVALASAKADRKKAEEAKKETTIERKRRKQEIVNEAITSTFIDLNAPLTVEHKKLLITLLTKHYTEKMEHHDSYINATIEMALKKGIPHDLLNAFAKFPDAVAPFPGFVYVASQEYGQGLQFKVCPKIPLYFQPNDCNNIVRKLLSAGRLASLDKAVAFFHKYKNTRSKQEIKIAEALTRIATFFQLVKKDAFWYEALVNELKKQ